MGIPVCCKDFDDTVADLDDRYIEGTAAEIVYKDLLLFFIVETISQGGCRRLVDDTLDIETCNLAGILGSLPLGIVEVSGNRDDGLGDLLAQVALCITLQLLQDHRGNLLGRILLAINRDMIILAHLPLDGAGGAGRIGDGLAFA